MESKQNQLNENNEESWREVIVVLEKISQKIKNYKKNPEILNKN